MSPLVLCYHAVSPTWEHRLSMPPDRLLAQVRALQRTRRLRVTFDDAYRNAASTCTALRDLGVPVQIFVCSGFARNGRPLLIPELEGDDPTELATMTWGELRSLQDRGVEIGSHTVTHPHLTSLSDSELESELTDSKREIETELDVECTDLAYPYGEHDERVRAAARAAGYERAFALWGGPREDPYALPRLDLYRRHSPFRALLMTTPLHRLVA